MVYPNKTAIYEIQGEGFKSPYENEQIRTTGVVTAIVQNGFYIQDPHGDNNEKTSDGIFVYVRKKIKNLKVGYSVEVVGTVKEYKQKDSNDLTLTEIITTKKGVSITSEQKTAIKAKDLSKIKKAKDLFETRKLYESLEGMLVSLPKASVTSTQTRYGDIYAAQPFFLFPIQYELSNASLKNNLNSVQNGTIVSKAVGIFYYSFSEYKVGVMNDLSFSFSKKEKPNSSFHSKENNLTGVTYNVYNMHQKSKHLKDIAFDISQRLNTPDIIALQEVQDDDGPRKSLNLSSDKTLDKLIEHINKNQPCLNQVNYQYLYLEPDTPNADGGQPGGNIRCVILYNANKIKPAHKIAKLKTEPFKGSRKPLITHFKFNGETYSIIVVHFSSKGGDEQPFETNYPAVKWSEKKRVRQSQAVIDYIEKLRKEHPNRKIVCLGDYNATNKDPAYKNIEKCLSLPKSLTPQSGTHIFKGFLSQLDHVLVSKNLQNRTTVKIVACNAGFKKHSSDHNPVAFCIE